MINVTLEEIKAMNISLNSPVEELRKDLLEAMLSRFLMEESLLLSLLNFSVEYPLIVAKAKFSKLVEQMNFHEAFPTSKSPEHYSQEIIQNFA